MASSDRFVAVVEEEILYIASLIGRAVILVITYLKTFKTAVIVLIGKVRIFLMTNGPIISSVRFSKLIIPS
jgi:hypothetical protein